MRFFLPINRSNNLILLSLALVSISIIRLSGRNPFMKVGIHARRVFDG